MKIADVAKRAGVSPSTVSRVLNNTAVVSEGTRQRVMKVIEESNYTPNLAARSLSRQSAPNNIGIVVPDIDNPFFLAVLREITREADKYGYNMLLFNTDESPEREHRFLCTVREQNLRGIIMIPLSRDDDMSLKHLTDLEAAGVPVVLMDRSIGNDAFSGVFTDDCQDAYRAVKVLAGAGHTRIATIAGNQRSSSARARLDGYMQAMRDCGLKVRQEYIRYGNFKYDDSYMEAAKLLKLPEPPTAVFTANNFSTLAMIKCILEHGLNIGRDISIIGFDELEGWLRYSPMFTPDMQISLVERPLKQMADEAMELLVKRIDSISANGSGRDPVRKTILLGNRLVLRGSERLG